MWEFLFLNDNSHSHFDRKCTNICRFSAILVPPDLHFHWNILYQFSCYCVQWTRPRKSDVNFFFIWSFQRSHPTCHNMLTFKGNFSILLSTQAWGLTSNISPNYLFSHSLHLEAVSSIHKRTYHNIVTRNPLNINLLTVVTIFHYKCCTCWWPCEQCYLYINPEWLHIFFG
jgi:hypothetical protein